MSFQSISDLSSAIASLADWGQKISCEFFEIKMKKFRKSMKHKGLVSNPCSKSAPRQGLSAALDLRSLKLCGIPASSQMQMMCGRRESAAAGRPAAGEGEWFTEIMPETVP